MGCCCSKCSKADRSNTSGDAEVTRSWNAAQHNIKVLERYDISSHQEDTTRELEQANEIHNDFHEGIMRLETQHKHFMHQSKKYQISVYRYLGFGGHHAIVISDGTNPHITFELTVMAGKSQAISGKEKAIAKVTEFSGDKNSLEFKGEVNCSL